MKIEKLQSIAESNTSRILAHIQQDKTWAMISSYTSSYSEAENKQRLVRLKNIVRNDLKLGYNQFISRWVGDGEVSDEQAIFIHNIDPKKAIELGKQFEQSSVIINDENGCREICTTPFEHYCCNDVVRTYKTQGNNILNINDAIEIFENRKGGPASKPIKGGAPFHLSELYLVHSPRPSYFQNEYHYTKLWSKD